MPDRLLCQRALSGHAFAEPVLTVGPHHEAAGANPYCGY